MNKTELITEIALQSGLTRKQAEQAVKAFGNVIVEALKKGEKVQMTGFGSFEVRERAARVGRNPANGEATEIPARKVPAFKPAQAFKDSIEG